MKYLRLHFLLLLISAGFIFSSVNAQNDRDYNELKEYLQKANEQFEMPGMAVGIIKDGQVVFNEAFGKRNTKTGEKTNTETIFGIASCTKAFTAACMAILVDEGKLDWTDKVIDHYPDFKLHDPYITREMEVQDLLCHRSGLQTFDGDLLWYGTDYTRKEVVERIQFRENAYSFRSRFGYQNVMYIAAGQLIEKVSGKSWDEFMKEKIFIPLGMNATTTSNGGFNESMNLAYPHIDGEPMEFINYDNCGPAASINTSSDDLLKWVELFLNKGTLNGQTIFSEKQYYKLTSLLTPLNPGPGETIGETHFFGYGLGWFVLDYEGRKVIQHGGGLPGFHSKVALIPEEKVGFIILANQLSGLVEATYKRIIDIYTKNEQKDWAQLYYENEQNQESRNLKKKEEKEIARVKGTTPSLSIEKYIGMYEDKMYGKAEISLKENRLHIELLPSNTLFTAEMEHWHYDTFKFQFNDPFLPEGYATFVLNGQGNPDYFTIDLENPDFHFFKLKFEKINEN
ncbi:MAG: serine hydrolase [Bacteroidales bacterium]